MADLGEVLVCAFLYLTFSGGIVRIYSWLISLGPHFWDFFALFFVIFLCLFAIFLLELVLAKINHRHHYGYVVYRRVRQRVYRPQRGAQVPIQGGPMNPQVQQMHAQPHLNGRIPHVQNQQCAQRDIGLRQLRRPGFAEEGMGAPSLPHVQNQQCAQRDIGLRQLRRPGFAEEGMGAPPLRRSERLRAKKEAEERAQPVVRRRARLQAMDEAEQRVQPVLRRSARLEAKKKAEERKAY